MKIREACEARLDRLNTYINLDRYPIHEPDSSDGQALIAQAQRMMESDTLCLLAPDLQGHTLIH